MPVSRKRARKKLHKQMAAMEVAHRWSKWRRTHATTLLFLGIPEIYLKCEDYWYDFLQHGHLHCYADPGEDDAARAYDVAKLSIEQARAFFGLIQDDYSDGWSNVDHVIYRVHELIENKG